jgi:hypothetical protein
VKTKQLIIRFLPTVENKAILTVGTVDLLRHDLQLSIRFAERDHPFDIAS